MNIVLEISIKNNVRINKDKCQLNKDTIEFLGHVISGEGVSPNPEKIKAICNAPEPKSVLEVQSFVGMVTYYSRFIPNCSSILSSLYDLTKKTNKFIWSNKCKDSFIKIKELLVNSNILTTFKNDHKLILECDASPTGVGAVLIQVENNVERPIAFASKKLNSAEVNYSQIDREALALVFGVTKFKYYLLGRKFELRTDHKPLIGLFNNFKVMTNNANARIVRWALVLSQFTYDIVYKAGKTNVVADMLSRLSIETDFVINTPKEYINLVSEIEYFDVTFQDISKLSNEENEIKELKNYIKFGFPNNKNGNQYFNYKNDLSLYKDVVLFKNRLLIPSKLREKILNMLHSTHNGVVAMKEEARGYVWWPNINDDIENLTKSCNICFKNFKPNNDPILSWPIPNKPWARLHIDYCGPIDNKFLLVIVDATSKFIDVHISNSTSSSSTINLLRQSFSNFGIPDVIVSDNAAYFVSNEIKDFYNKNGIKLINPAPFNPSSNGLAERAVQTVKSGLNKFRSGSLQTRLARFLYNYRSTVHSGLKTTPAEVLFKRKFKTPLDIIKPNFEKGEDKYKDDNIDKFKDCNVKSFSLGQAVFAKNFNVNSKKKWLPGEIVEVLGLKNYKVKVFDVGYFVWKRHSSQLLERSLPISDCSVEDKIENKVNHPLESASVMLDLPISNGESNNNNSCGTNQPSQNQSSELQFLRRSSRMSKPPDRLNL